MFCNKSATLGCEKDAICGCLCATISAADEEVEIGVCRRALIFFVPPLAALALGAVASEALPAIFGLAAAAVGAVAPLVRGAAGTENKRCE